MSDKDSKPSAKVESYTISIKGGNRERTIKLSSGLLLIGTGAYSFYSTMKMQRDASTIQEIAQALR